MRMANFQPAMGQRLYNREIPLFSADPPARLSATSDIAGKPKTEPVPLRIFAAFAHAEWEKDNFQYALEEVGEVIRFRWNFSDQSDPDWHVTGKTRMNREMLDALSAAHREKPIDIFFGRLSGSTVFPGFIRAINHLGIRTLNIFLGAREDFVGTLEATGHSGMLDIAGAFSLNWTGSEDTLPLYETAGARVIYLPRGANSQLYKPLEMPFDMDVSFVGQHSGQRSEIIEDLRRRGIRVEAFGKGWPSGEIPEEEMIAVFNRSRINLGFASVDNTKGLPGLKGHDFKVSMGGGLYFAPYRRELGDVYEIGREIVCYHTADDLAEKIRFFLSHPDRAEEIRRAGQRRALQDHAWSCRFRQAFRALGVPLPGGQAGNELLKTRKQRRILLRATANGRYE
jgi:spore maturation protein CgeB